MSEEKGFTVKDRRRVKVDEPSADTKDEPSTTDSAQDGENRTKTVRPGGETSAQTLPPVDFAGFVLGLGQMALVHLGEIPEPQTGQATPNLDQARHTIDLLDLFDEKTRGNLTPEEANLLRALKSELKLKYVKIASETKAT